MRKLRTIIFAMIFLFWSCSDELIPKQDRAIFMSVNMGELSLDVESATKAEGQELVKADPVTNNTFSAQLWYSYSPGNYSHAPEAPQYIPCVTTIEYSDSTRNEVKVKDDEGKDHSVLYPISNDQNYSDTDAGKVYCVGLYPADGWSESQTLSEGEKVLTTTVHAIDGSTDLMYSDQMVGSYSANFETQEYKHLLTWVKINMSATSLKAANVWGEVKSLSIVSPKNQVQVAFSNQTVTEDDVEKLAPAVIEYTGESGEFPLALPDDKRLSITTKTFAEVFCAPPASREPAGPLGYTLKLSTSNMAENQIKEVFVELKKEDDSADARGKLFVITLHFNELSVIEGVCTLRQWDDQSSEIYLK